MIIIALAVVCAGLACQGPVAKAPSGPDFWVTDTTDRVFTWKAIEHGDFNIYDDGAERITLTGAGGEVVGFQVILPASSGGETFEVTIDPFRGPPTVVPAAAVANALNALGGEDDVIWATSVSETTLADGSTTVPTSVPFHRTASDADLPASQPASTSQPAKTVASSDASPKNSMTTTQPTKPAEPERKRTWLEVLFGVKKPAASETPASQPVKSEARSAAPAKGIAGPTSKPASAASQPTASKDSDSKKKDEPKKSGWSFFGFGATSQPAAKKEDSKPASAKADAKSSTKVVTKDVKLPAASAKASSQPSAKVKPKEKPLTTLPASTQPTILPGPVIVDTPAIRVYRTANISVRTYDAIFPRTVNAPVFPAGFPDALVPMSAGPNGSIKVAATPDQATVLWIEWTMPKHLKRQTLGSTISVRANGRSRSVPIEVVAWGVDLPPVPVGAYARLSIPKVWRQIGNLGELRDRDAVVLSENSASLKSLCERVEAISAELSRNGLEVWPTGIYPRIAGRVGDEEIDFGGYRHVAEAVARGAERTHRWWPVPVGLSYPPPARFGRIGEASYQSFLRRYIDAFRTDILRPDVTSATPAFLDWPMGDASIVGDIGWQTLLGAVHNAWPKLTILDPFVSSELNLFGYRDFKAVVLDKDMPTIACPPGGVCDPAKLAELRDAGKTVWWRCGESPAVPDVRVTEERYRSRAIGWLAWRYDVSGVVIGDAVGEIGDGSNDAPAFVGSTRDWLVYPGEWFGMTGVVPSVRLKMIHRGLQDAAVLKALDRAGKHDVAEMIARSVVRFGHLDAIDGSLWNLRDDGLCEDVRAWTLASRVASIEYAGADVRATAMAGRSMNREAMRQQLQQISGRVALECQGVQASACDDLDRPGAVTWTYYVSLRNLTDRTRSGKVRMGLLPTGFAAERGEQVWEKIAWAMPYVSRLTVTSDAASVGPYGWRLQEAVFDAPNESPVVIGCRTCAIAADRLDRSIRVDGDFRDWPDPMGPMAGEFWRVVTSVPMNAGDRRAQWPTQAQVGFDGRQLCLAIRCMQPKDSLRREQTNRVQVSGGSAWGEDLVEIILDPDNRRSTDPNDVYHVIVKANGAVTCTRGMPPGVAGGSQGWSAQVSAAVEVFDDRWQAEVAIPIDAMDANEKLNRWWGMDIVRVSAAIAEQSTWSGATTQLYAPISLGNVYVGR